MKVAVIDAYHAFHFEVLEKMLMDHQIRFTYMITGTARNFHGDPSAIEKAMLALKAQDCRMDTVNQFIFPDRISELASVPWTLDEPLLKKCSLIESYFLRLSDRFAAFHLPVHIRRQYYQLILNYFNHILIENPPDRILTFDTPHSIGSYTFYELARIHGIRVLRQEHHFIDNRSLLLPVEIPEIPTEYEKDTPIDQLWESLPLDLQNDFSTYSTFIAQANKREKKALVSKSASGSLKLKLRFLKKAGMNLFMGIFPFLFKKEILHFTSLNAIKSPFVYRFRINNPLHRLIRLNAYYNKISVVPDLDQPYIFFGMHMQPEKTSQPLGREFDHQLLPILMLAKCLPQSWKVYVKEHPNQFNERKIANANFRNKVFYDILKRQENIELIDLGVPSGDLINNAKIVSTLTGTMGWEALKAGKPVLAFGDSYYRPCGAVRSPLSLQDCTKDIADLSQLDPDQVKRELLRYLKFIDEKSFLVRSGNSELKLSTSELSREEQLGNLTEAIIKHLNNED